MDNEVYKKISSYVPNNKQITNKTYASRVNILMKKNIDIEDYTTTVSYLIKNYKEKTYKSFITSIIVYLKSIGKVDKTDQYSKELKKVNDKIQKEYEKNEASPSELKNMVKKSEIESLIRDFDGKLSIVIPSEGNSKYFDTYQRYLVLNLYYLIQPLRNDYVNLEVYDNPVFFPDKTKNYIYLSRKELVLNRYKTSKTYGSGNVIILPEDLINIIKRWMEIRAIIYPSISSEKQLLLTQKLKPMEQVNLTQYLNRIFGRKVSSTMLRKSYLSEKYPVSSSISEMKEDAKAMQHSVSVQQTIYRKK